MSTFTSDLTLHHVRLVVGDTTATSRHMHRWGFTAEDVTSPRGLYPHCVQYSQGRIRIVATRADIGRAGALLNGVSPTDRVRRHGDAVCDIAVRTHDLAEVHRRALAAGATILRPPTTLGATSSMVLASPCGDLVHTVLEHPSNAAVRVPYLGPVRMGEAPAPCGLWDVDHFLLVCERAGKGGLEQVAEFYETVLECREVRSTTPTGPGPTRPVTLTSDTGDGAGVTFTLEAPTGEAGARPDRFLARNNGPGVRYTALATDDIIASVRKLRDMGAQLADTPTGTLADGATRWIAEPRNWHSFELIERAPEATGLFVPEIGDADIAALHRQSVAVAS